MGLNNSPDNTWVGDLRITGALLGSGEDYSDASSFQVIAPDLSLGADAGSADGGDPKFLAAVMGNVLGDSLTKDANYLAGLIGAYSITGAKATSYPTGAVLGLIMDTVTAADGAVVAVIDGDSGVTKANAAFKAMSNNSSPGSGFDFGVDLHGAAHDSYLALAILKADVRMSHEVCLLSNAGVPDSSVGAGTAEVGSICVDRSAGKLYVNGGSKATPSWKLVTSA